MTSRIITVEVLDAPVQALLARLAQRLGRLQPVLDDIAEDVVQRAKARFGTSAGPDGAPWKPKKQPDGRPPLVGASGNLRRQIVRQAAGPDAVQIAATMAYSAIHQFGGRIARAAGSVTVRHRTTAKGELLRSQIMGGRGLVFAKAGHKRALARSFATKAHAIVIPARPYLPVTRDGTLYPVEQRLIVETLQRWLEQAANEG